VVEGEKEGEKTKVQAFMKVVYDLCGKTKTVSFCVGYILLDKITSM
jgi:hypothetical protein